MKKLFLFILPALVVSFSSCSSDDDSAGPASTVKTLSMKVDGVQKTFNTITVEDNSVTINGSTVKWYTVTASDEDTSEMVTFDLLRGVKGPDMIDIHYIVNNRTYTRNYEMFMSNVTNNTSKKLKGTFSGEIRWNDIATGDEEILTVTEGSFEINR